MPEKMGDERDAGKGFAGLLTLLSDVDGDIEAARRKAAAWREPEPESDTVLRASSSNEDRIWKYSAAAFALVLVFLFLYFLPSQKSSPNWRSSIPPIVDVDLLKLKYGLISKTPIDNPAKTSQKQPEGHSKEEMPPVGTETVLNSAQIQYCLSEDIRLEAGGQVVDTHSASEVGRYNSLVADYNSRCGRFRYKKVDMEEAKRIAEGKKAILQAEGAARFSKVKSNALPKVPETAPANRPREGQELVQKSSSTSQEKVQGASQTRELSSWEVDAATGIILCVQTYFQSLQKKDVGAAIKCYAAKMLPKIKRSHLEAVAKDTEYYQFEDVDVNTGFDKAKCEILLLHKKNNLPAEKWKMTIELIRETGEWKIRAMSGKKVIR